LSGVATEGDWTTAAPPMDGRVGAITTGSVEEGDLTTAVPPIDGRVAAVSASTLVISVIEFEDIFNMYIYLKYIKFQLFIKTLALKCKKSIVK
jgi:hypothetical protein